MYECPICGKDSNRRGDPFEQVSRVVNHIDGCHDEDHHGVSGEELREEIEATATDTPAPDEDEAVPSEDGDASPPEEDAPLDEVEPSTVPEESSETNVEPETQGEEADEPLTWSPQEDSEPAVDDVVEDPEPAPVQDPPAVEDDDLCPECGAPLDTDVEGSMFQTKNGDIATLTAEDGLCSDCDLLVDVNGTVYIGSEHGIEPPECPYTGCTDAIFTQKTLKLEGQTEGLLFKKSKTYRLQPGERFCPTHGVIVRSNGEVIT